MADWYPGAWKVLIGGNGFAITQRPAENIFHIAASSWNIPEGRELDANIGIPGWVQGARSCQTYTDQYGNMQQYCGLFVSVNGTKNGNWRCRTHEAWNPEGLTGTAEEYNASEYTPEQCERFADFLAWDHIENGAILSDMGDSRPGSHGCGCHRYGIDPWRISGGEVWTSAAGKVCPGTARVRQLPGIIERAKVIAAAVRAGRCTFLAPGRIDLKFALARTGNAPLPNKKDWFDMATPEELENIVQRVVARNLETYLADSSPYTSNIADKVCDRLTTPGRWEWFDRFWYGQQTENLRQNIVDRVVGTLRNQGFIPVPKDPDPKD